MNKNNESFESEHEKSLQHRLWHKLVGEPRNINEPSLFHKISLIPILAWIGLGADGLSSSSYGPEEAFRALGSHTYIAILIGVATAFTVFIIAMPTYVLLNIFLKVAADILYQQKPSVTALVLYPAAP